MRPLLYIVRDASGTPQAIHQRSDTPEGKRFAWWSAGPDGEPVPSLNGRSVSDLPLFGSQHVGKWDVSRPVFLVEGEADTLALANAGHRVLGTVTGASTIPSPASLSVLIGLHVRAWPDNDRGGVDHMQAIAHQIHEVVASLRWVEWPDAPPGGGAADYLERGLRVEDLRLVAVPALRPTPAELIEFAAVERRRRARAAGGSHRWTSPIETFNASVTVSEVLRRDFGLEARPGHAVRCPFHDDRNPSLSILPDDRRAYCHAPSCPLSGRGADAWDLAHRAPQGVA